MTEHLWEGQARDYWIRALQDPDDKLRWKAIDALRHIACPSETIALFIGALNDGSWAVRALAAHALYDLAHEEQYVLLLVQQAIIPLGQALSNESLDVRLSAAYTLEAIGPSAVAALPQLEEAAKSGEVQLSEAAINAIRAVYEAQDRNLPS